MPLLSSGADRLGAELHSMHHEQFAKIRAMTERLQQLRRFPESRSLIELRQYMQVFRGNA